MRARVVDGSIRARERGMQRLAIEHLSSQKLAGLLLMRQLMAERKATVPE
jgi:hypothetical protein